MTSDGRKVEVLLNATTRVDATNTPIGVIGVGQDITERKTAEQEVSRLAMDLERLIDSANAPILGVDRDGRISEWNQNMSDLSGYTKSAVLGMPLATCDFIDVENRTSVGDVLARALEGVDCRNLEFSINSKDGRRVELLLNAATRRDAQGSIVGVVGVGQDITEKKYMEKAEINAAKMRASNDAKGNFLASMSHEMRTPLNGVLGMLQLAMSYELPQEVRKNVQNAYMSGEHLLNLVNDILDVSKIEAGKLELEMKPFSVTEVYRAAMGIVRPQAAAKGLIMELEIAQDLPLYARGDQQRIRQVLLNLLYNAVKFTVRGSVTLSVGVKETTPTHYCLTTSVSDTGIGMDEPSQKKLFGMFIKIKDARVRNPLGVGLGLAICKQLVELMGGSIWVESAYGTGSNFSFTLKVERADAESDIQMVEEEMLAQNSLDVGEADMQPATILVAEDNEFNMEVVKTMLQSMGHTVDIVWDGSECLECLFDSGGQPMLHPQIPNRLKYDVIFMDCNMPVMDGYETCRLIRKSEAQFGLEPVPIVALTAYAMPGDRDKCLGNGMTDYLTKPMSKQALRKLVSRYAPVGQQTDATRTTPIPGKSSLNDTPKQSSRSMMIPAVYPGSRGVVNYVPVKTPLSTGMKVGQPRAPSTSTSSAFRVRGDGTSGALPPPQVLALADKGEHQSGAWDPSLRSSGRSASKEGVPARKGSVEVRDEAVESYKEPLPDAPPEERKGGARLVPELCASPMASTKPIESVLDYKRALAQLGGDENLMRRMLLHFISYSRNIPSKLISAASSGAFDVVRREAHSLKGSASYLGATVVPELAEKLQVAAGEADLRQISSLIGELGYALDMLRRDAERRASPQDAHYSACAQDESSTAHGQSEAEVERGANTSSRHQRRSVSSGDSQISRDARSTDSDVEEAVAAETRILSDDTCAGPTADMSARVDIEDEPTRELMQGGNLAKMVEALFIAADVDGLSSDAFLSAAERMHARVLLSAAEHDVLLSDGFELLRLLRLLPKDLAHVTDVDAVLRRLALHVEARDWPETRESLQGSNDLALRMYCDDPGVLERMKATFASQAADLLVRVSESVANGNLRRAGLEAHSLRGMAMYIGNPQIAAAALTLSTEATSGVADGALVTALLQRLRHEVLTVCQSEPATASAQGDERRFTSLSQQRVEHLINILARRSIGYFMERLTHADCLPDCKLIASLIARLFEQVRHGAADACGRTPRCGRHEGRRARSQADDPLPRPLLRSSGHRSLSPSAGFGDRLGAHGAHAPRASGRGGGTYDAAAHARGSAAAALVLAARAGWGRRLLLQPRHWRDGRRHGHRHQPQFKRRQECQHAHRYGQCTPLALSAARASGGRAGRRRDVQRRRPRAGARDHVFREARAHMATISRVRSRATPAAPPALRGMGAQDDGWAHRCTSARRPRAWAPAGCRRPRAPGGSAQTAASDPLGITPGPRACGPAGATADDQPARTTQHGARDDLRTAQHARRRSQLGASWSQSRAGAFGRCTCE